MTVMAVGEVGRFPALLSWKSRRLSHVKAGDKPYEQRELSSSFLMPTEQFGKLVAYTVASTSLRCKRS
jgi:hypothetical protein